MDGPQKCTLFWIGIGRGRPQLGNRRVVRLPLGDCKFELNIGIHSVPVSKLPDLVYETKKDLKEAGLVSIMVGHAGPCCGSHYVVHDL